jgi:hypothetical protein
MKVTFLTLLVGMSFAFATALPLKAEQGLEADPSVQFDDRYQDRPASDRERDSDVREDDRSPISRERWRYRRHNNQWWYWHPENYWLLWRDGAWRPYVSEPYRRLPRERLLPGRPANFYRDAWFYDRDRGFYSYFRGPPTGLSPYFHRGTVYPYGAGWEAGPYGRGVPTGVHTDPSIDLGFSDYGNTVLPGPYDRGIVR